MCSHNNYPNNMKKNTSLSMICGLRHRYVKKYFSPLQNRTTGEWNGLVRALLDGDADLAVGAMTINYAREQIIDFTKPFMNLGISILLKIPSGKPTRLFSFMNPLAVEIWL